MEYLNDGDADAFVGYSHMPVPRPRSILEKLRFLCSAPDITSGCTMASQFRRFWSNMRSPARRYFHQVRHAFPTTSHSTCDKDPETAFTLNPESRERLRTESDFVLNAGVATRVLLPR